MFLIKSTGPRLMAKLRLIYPSAEDLFKDKIDYI